MFDNVSVARKRPCLRQIWAHRPKLCSVPLESQRNVLTNKQVNRAQGVNSFGGIVGEQMLRNAGPVKCKLECNCREMIIYFPRQLRSACLRLAITSNRELAILVCGQPAGLKYHELFWDGSAWRASGYV